MDFAERMVKQMKLIDADALLNRMTKAMESGSNLNGTFHLHIEHAPTIQRPTWEWIPVSEKPPETGDSILVTYSDGEVGIVWSARPKVWGKYEKANNLIFPVAWMPLPEPYREDGEA